MIRVVRKDFVRRSRVRLFHGGPGGCGSTTVHCDIKDAPIYEAGFKEHVCGLEPDALRAALADRPAFAAMLRHMAAPILDPERVP